MRREQLRSPTFGNLSQRLFIEGQGVFGLGDPGVGRIQVFIRVSLFL